MPVPLLILSDSPDLHTGLGRITRDLATLTASLPEFRVGTLGRGGYGNRSLPFMQYNFPESHQWGEMHIERVWKNFAGNQKGIIFTIWDASRLLWFSQPQPGDSLLPFLSSGSFKRWGYFPVDSVGVGDKLTTLSRAAVQGFDRVLGYGAWGAQVLSNGLGREVDWIPHGISLETFTPRDRAASRMAIGLADDDVAVACVMTNQSRKDWGVAMGAIALLANDVPNLKFLIHVDVLDRAWSIRALMADFGIERRCQVSISGSMNDVQLSYLYSAADLTILPSTEGWGFPIAESLACGTPVVHGTYGGGAELVPESSWLVEPVSYRLDTPHNVVRPVWNPADWAKTMKAVLDAKPTREQCRAAVEHLDWSRLYPSAWKKWLLEGLK